MKKIKEQCDLQSCFFCKSCLPEWLPAVDLIRTTFSIKKGGQLFEEGQKVNGIFFINKGTVKVHKHWGDEKELILRFATQGDIVGHRGIGLENVFPVTATAITDVTACFIELEFFLKSIKVNQELLFQLMMFFAAELQESEKKMRDLVNLSVRERMIKALYFLQNKFGNDENGDLNINISRQDLASFVGTTYETYFRVLNELESESLVSLAGKKIRLNTHS